MKLQISSPRQVANLDDFLPPGGESRVEMFYSDGVLILDVFYELEEPLERKAKRRVLFKKAKHFIKMPFPGLSLFDCADDRELSLLNSVVEYENSELLEMDAGAPGGGGYKHYRLFLHSVGVAIHVIAQTSEVSEEQFPD